MNSYLIKRLLVYLNYPRFLLHLLAYTRSVNRTAIIEDINKSMSLCPYRFSGGSSLVYLLLFDKYFRTLFYKRIGNIGIILSVIARPSETFIIASSMEIGEGMLCIHPFSTILNANRIGKNFTIRNNVTVGNNDAIIGEESRPTIGDNVTINVHSVIVGNITIGNNVIIGAGCVLLKSVPDNCIVVGNPARIIKKDGQRVDICL